MRKNRPTPLTDRRFFCLTELTPPGDRIPPPLPVRTTPSTHEIIPDPSAPNTYWITGPAHNTLVRFDANTGQTTSFPLGDGTAPHGIGFDCQGRL